jgi:hypothetical protein
MKLIQKISLILLVGSWIILISGCEKVVNVDLNETESKVVIEGWIYTTPGPYKVQLTRTGSYFSSNPAPTISGALVIIRDNAGNVDTLSETEPGIYSTHTLQGVSDRTYSLQVTTNGNTYTATEFLPDVTTIDTLGAISGKDLPFGDKDFYYVTFYAWEPQDKKNWYRFILSKYSTIIGQDSIVNNEPGDWIVTDDGFVKGDIAELPFITPFEFNDSVTVIMQSLSQPAFDYLAAMQIQVTSDGGMFSPPPANPKSNISGGAIGYFGASDVATKSIRVKP